MLEDAKESARKQENKDKGTFIDEKTLTRLVVQPSYLCVFFFNVTSDPVCLY